MNASNRKILSSEYLTVKMDKEDYGYFKLQKTNNAIKITYCLNNREYPGLLKAKDLSIPEDRDDSKFYDTICSLHNRVDECWQGTYTYFIEALCMLLLRSNKAKVRKYFKKFKDYDTFTILEDSMGGTIKVGDDEVDIFTSGFEGGDYLESIREAAEL